jgi:hypothetical protein
MCTVAGYSISRWRINNHYRRISRFARRAACRDDRCALCFHCSYHLEMCLITGNFLMFAIRRTLPANVSMETPRKKNNHPGMNGRSNPAMPMSNSRLPRTLRIMSLSRDFERSLLPHMHEEITIYVVRRISDVSCGAF